MKKIFIFFMLIMLVFVGIYCFNCYYGVHKYVKMNKKGDVRIEIINKKEKINGHKNISVPQIKGDNNTVQNINKMILEKIEMYIDKASNLYDFHYSVMHNDGRYVSIIIEMMQYRESLPHPGKQAHAINIDFRDGKIIDNKDLVSDKSSFFEDIKNGKYMLLTSISNNVSYSSDYIKNKTIEEIEEMFNNNSLELFMSNESIGFIATLPYAIGNYAIFEKRV